MACVKAPLAGGGVHTLREFSSLSYSASVQCRPSTLFCQKISPNLRTRSSSGGLSLKCNANGMVDETEAKDPLLLRVARGEGLSLDSLCVCVLKGIDHLK